MIGSLDRSQYGQIYHDTFGKAAGRETCRKGWERWQKVLAANHWPVTLSRRSSVTF